MMSGFRISTFSGPQVVGAFVALAALSGCFNTKLPVKLSTLRNDPGLIESSPLPSPPSSAVLMQCQEGSRNIMTPEAVLARLGVAPSEATLVSLTAAVAGELGFTRLSSLVWQIECPSQFVHWLTPAGTNLVAGVNYQLRDRSGALSSGTALIEVSRWQFAPNWTAAGPSAFSVTADGKILMTTATQSFILPPSRVPGAGGGLNSPRFYAVVKASDNVALYAIGTAPQGSALYRVHPSTGELWTLTLSTLPAPTIESLQFVSSSELEIVSGGRAYRGSLPSSPRTGRVLESPVDD